MTTRELSPQEATDVTNELKAVLEKHGCEMSVTSSIVIMKVQEDKEEGVLSPIQDVNPGTNDNSTSETKEGS